MSRRRKVDETQGAFSFDAVAGAVTFTPDPIALPADDEPVEVEIALAPEPSPGPDDVPVALASDAPPPDGPALEELSPRTRAMVVPTEEPAPTVMAHGIGDVKMGQAFVESDDRVVRVREAAVPPDPHKPPYRIPLMSEIAALPWNGLTVVSTFSGCGGSCLGFKMAGYHVAWANEFVPAAQETYRANHPMTHLSTQDIRTVTGAQIREVIGDVEIDVFEGSPPCASFSTAGKKSKGWGQVRKYSDVEQRTDDLFSEYVRLVGELRPRAFVAENVSGMVKGVSKGFFKEYLALFKELPYNVEARLLDAQDLGVPQRRVRLIFIGVRKDVGRPRWPLPIVYRKPDGSPEIGPDGMPRIVRYSIREAIPWILSTTGKAHSESDWQKPEDRLRAELPAPTVPTGSSLGSYYGHDVERDDSRPRVVYYEGFKERPPEDVTDRPAPTIKVGADGLCSTHFIVEGAGAPDDDTAVSRKFFEEEVRIVGGNGAVGDAKGAEIDPDAPAPTVLAGGQGPHGRRDRDDQFIVERRVVVGGSAPSGQRGETSVDEPAPTVVGGNAGGKCQFYVEEHVVEPESRLGPAVGAEWDKLQQGGQSDKYLNLVRPSVDAPCPTVTQLGGTSAASVTHPIERRKFSIAELRRICGFPDDFILTGSYQQQWERLGRAVPPPMMRAVAEALIPVLKRDA